MPGERFLITGAMGCIGAWTIHNLVKAGIPTAAFDLSANPHRLRLLLDDEEISQVQFITGDVTDLAVVERAIKDSRATHVIHLAALQVPFCRADPVLGARVNVVGTVNVLEAIRREDGQVLGFAYASSVAAFGSAALYEKPIAGDAPLRPDTLYGVYKMANEHTARVYWQDWGISSVGLRPYIVYGVGRDQGLTSDLAKAILAAAAGRLFHINFGGQVALQYAPDAADTFIAAARANHHGAAVCNLRNDVVDVADFIAALQAEAPTAQITHDPHRPLPFPADLDDTTLRHIIGDPPHTPLPEAIRHTLAHYRTLIAEGKIDLG